MCVSDSSYSWIIWKNRKKGTVRWSNGKKKGRSPVGDVDDEKEKCLFKLRMEGLLQQLGRRDKTDALSESGRASLNIQDMKRDET